MMHRASPKGAPMTTKLRRITISLPAEFDVALAAMAKIEGKPQASVISGLLVELTPTMVSMVKIHNQLKQGQAFEAKRTMQHLFGDQMAGLLSEQLELAAPKGKAKNGAKPK
jgi:hypothetical protein